MTGATSQCGRILKFLKKNRVATNAQLNSMGIYRYSARIHSLRQEGWIIESTRVHDSLWKFELKGHRDDEAAA